MVPGVDLGPMDQEQANAAEACRQQPAGLARRGAHRQLQGRVARGGGGAVDIGPPGDQCLHHLLVEYVGSHVQGRHAGPILGVDLGPVLRQDGQDQVGPVDGGQVQWAVPVAAVHPCVHLGPMRAQDAEAQDGVALDVRQHHLDLVPWLRPRGRGDGPVQQHQVQGGEALRVPGIGIRGRLHSAHSGDGLAGRATLTRETITTVPCDYPKDGSDSVRCSLLSWGTAAFSGQGGMPHSTEGPSFLSQLVPAATPARFVASSRLHLSYLCVPAPPQRGVQS